MTPTHDCDVLVVGAGPTGLTLAAQLARFGIRFRNIDKQLDRARESRALAVQARSLEILQALGLGEELARRGSATTRAMLHVDRDAPPALDLGNVARTDTLLRRGPKAGHRLPDARLLRRDATVYLQQELASPHLHLLLCGDVAAWDVSQLSHLRNRFPGLLAVTHLTRDDGEEALVDAEGRMLAELGVEQAAQYLIRPDGHIAFRCAGRNLNALTAYIERWFSRRD